MGSSNGAPALVANAPSAPDRNHYETSRPVTGSSESAPAQSDGGRPDQRGAQVNLSV
jgi:hypothetical protein